ncbi:MAG: S1 RNA-binding domain-containing protein [Micromonosporaceae bacterium]|nr:S1 RNA-binding domain-containing protein [Micromonosporaceae bacterium]
MSRPHSNEPAHTNELAWPAFVARYRVGDVADGEVVSVVPFGAFIRIDDVDGFSPKASWSALPEPGSRVRVRIEAIDNVQRRFALAPA